MPPFPTRDRRCLGGHWALIGLRRGGSGSIDIGISVQPSGRPWFPGSQDRNKKTVSSGRPTHMDCAERGFDVCSPSSMTCPVSASRLSGILAGFRQ